MSTLFDVTQIVADKCSYRLVRERSYTGSYDDLLQVMHDLRQEKATGKLTVDFSQGGINRVRFREEQDIHY